jgi:hypothetical protein
MAEKIKSWWSDDGKWFCLLVDDGVSKATVSLTPEEAKSLAGNADPDVYDRLQAVRRQRDDVTAALNRTQLAK